jgi:FixJ family two-component response regulator
MLVSIVDDDPFMRAATTSLVRSLGWEAREFDSAGAFLDSNALEGTRCLVCDVNMPGMTGFELVAQLLRERRLMPTVFVTAFVSEAVRERALDDGAMCLIGKPIDVRELETWIGHALAA